MQRGCNHLRHAPRSGSGRSVTVAATESATVQTNSDTSSDDAAVPVVSETASAEVPGSQVASQGDLEAAQQKTQAGRTEPTGATAGSEQRQASQRQDGKNNVPGRTGGRSAKRPPRTVRKEQLVQGAEFEGTVVSQQQPTQYAMCYVTVQSSPAMS